MILPEEIIDNNFYYYRGYIIRLYGNGAYALYKTHVGGGLGILSSEDRQKQLLYCMKSIDELIKERDEEDKRKKEMAKFLKQIGPYINAISNDIADKIYRNF